jgi:hypothetical protein
LRARPARFRAAATHQASRALLAPRDASQPRSLLGIAMSRTPPPAAAARRRFSPRLAAACLALACGALLLTSRGCSADPGGLGLDVANDAASSQDDQGVPSTGPEGTCPMGAAWRSVLHASELPPNVSASGNDQGGETAETESGGEAPGKPCAVQPATSASPLSDDEPRASLAELGRAAWRVVHATAAKVEDARDLDLFLQYMHSFVAVYPCRLCRTHAWARCGELMSAPTLVPRRPARRRAPMQPARGGDGVGSAPARQRDTQQRGGREGSRVD